MENNIINWDDVSETEYINEEGKYTLKVVSFEEKELQSGKVCHVYTCENKEKQKINVNLYLVEKAMFRYKQFVKALGLDAKGSVNLDTLPNTLIGRKFIGDIKKQPDRVDAVSGEIVPGKYMEVRNFLPVED